MNFGKMWRPATFSPDFHNRVTICALGNHLFVAVQKVAPVHPGSGHVQAFPERWGKLI
jgi:hypothetical protein